MKLGKIAVALAVVLAATGCTRSLEAKYAGGADPALAAPSKAVAQKIAVVPFADERAWVDKEDDQSRSYIAKQGAWRFGLTFEGQEFTPVSTLVQKLFVTELKAAGYDAVAAPAPVQGAAYNLSGRIVTFEFENETGVVTVTSRRAVMLALTLTDRQGKPVLDNQLIGDSDRENEGMGVMHSTNVDKLLNRVFKKVVNNVLGQMKSRLAGLGYGEIRITLNGMPLQLRADGSYVVAMR